jgi:hypothetical protein
MELSEADRRDFLGILADLPDRSSLGMNSPSTISVAKEPMRSCEGDISENPQVEVE